MKPETELDPEFQVVLDRIDARLRRMFRRSTIELSAVIVAYYVGIVTIILVVAK